MYSNAVESEDVEDMDTSDGPRSWYYLADCGQWHSFEYDACLIENHYLRDPKGVLQMLNNASSRIDFSAMLQTDLTTGRQKRIQRAFNIERRCCCYTPVPVFWENHDPKRPYQLMPLSKITPEYQTVEDYVKKAGLLRRPIVSISRIQNLDLWELFCRKKIQLMRIQGVSEIKEKRLFHGTKRINVDSICTNNFDLRLSGRHGDTYGKRIYFARYATYADKYTDPLPGHNEEPQDPPAKTMFLARVMIGKSNKGEKHYQKPDHGSSKNDHHSCIDDVKHPKIFVIFDPNQIYPEYLIRYY
ncbi:hypothetical protein LDENG_00074280 [Lucifuga dentata]|nr:hypothetical protein LDENG_00074280 [Lucifuga dentata]